MTAHYTSGVPLGGLGCGKMELCPDGAFRHLTTHNNIDMPFSTVNANDWPETVTASNHHSPEGLREAFLFAAVEGEGGRLLKSSEEEFFATTPAEELKFRGQYPCARLGTNALGEVRISVEAFSPLIPQSGEPKDSTLPAAVFLLRAENNGSTAKRVSMGLSFPNIIGVGGYPNALIADLRGNQTDRRDVEEALCLRYSHGVPKVDRRLNGEYALCAPTCEGMESSWVIGSWNEALWNYVVSEGKLTNSKSGMSLGDAGSVAAGSTGALCLSRHLQPGESCEMPLVLSWYFPDKPANDKSGVVYRNAYTRHFTDALAVARYALTHVKRLHQETKAWQEDLLQSSLPEWFSHKLINNLFPMSSCSMYLSDGRFGINEAPTHMAGCMGTIDQRSACVSPYVALLPEVAKSELKQFADQQIGPDHPERFGEHWDASTGRFGLKLDRLGAIKHEIGWDELEAGRLGNKVWCNLHWPDLSAVFVLQCYQQIIWTGDRELLHELWPKIKLALAFHKRLDQNGDGLADLWGPGSSTFDSDKFPYYGACTFVATLYLAALKAAMQLAEQMEEPETGKGFEADFEKARKTVENELWNEEEGYYNSWVDNGFENWKDGERAHDRVSENSMLSHLAGVWFARMLDLGSILDEDRVAGAIGQLYKQNVEPFPYCAPNEVMPDGKNSWSWPYYGEVYFAANAMYQGRVEEGMEMVRKFNEAAFVKNASHWDLPLSWEGDDNGTPWWGRWYMTNPSSWNVLLALSGLRYNALEKSLGLFPVACEEMNGFREIPIFLPGLRGSLSITDEGLVFKIRQAVNALELTRIQCADIFSGGLSIHGRSVSISHTVKEGRVDYTGVLRLNTGDVVTLRSKK